MARDSSSTDISIDSLEEEFRRDTSIKDGVSSEHVDTVLVPFYEKDVLIKVPKERSSKKGINRQGRSTDRLKPEVPNSSYLVNNHKARRTTYLERFRKQLTPHQKSEKQPAKDEIRSISPEVGDTERESIGEDPHNPVTEFYNTESYNEMYYEKLLSQDIKSYLENSFEEPQYAEEDQIKSPKDLLIENLKSVSEVSQLRHRVRRATVGPIENVKLGGLGPDMERIKPRLERARSLQRYSEKVRMENRLKIYKKSVQVDTDKKNQNERESSRQQSRIEVRELKEDTNASYLVNKTSQQKSSQQKSSQILSKLYPKSAGEMKSRVRSINPKTTSKDKSLNKQKTDANHHLSAKDKRKSVPEGDKKLRAKSSTRNKGINTEKGTEVPPVQINFMVNVGGVRPSSALRTLEEKHRMYQEQVKAFKMDNNNNL